MQLSMQLSLKSALATLALAALGLAATRTAAAQTIDTLPGLNYSVGNFGTPNTATFGQTIVSPTAGTLLDFTFAAHNGSIDPIVADAEVYGWKGAGATGLALFQSLPFSIVPGSGFTQITATPKVAVTIGLASSVRADSGGNGHKKPRYLYIWAGDQARTAPDFVSVIGFNEDSKDYGRVLKTVPVPTSGNEAHHMHLSADGNTLGCGGLLSLLRGQDGIFFFDVSTPDDPVFLKSASAPLSAITDDFYPLAGGGFLVTQMGSDKGGAPGRVAEFDANLNLVKEWPKTPPADGFNPHGISVRPEVNLMVTSDFLNPVTTLNVWPGPVELRASVRVWDFQNRTIVRTIPVTGALGTMDVKLIPGDPQRRAYSCGTFDGHIHLIDTVAGTSQPVFDTDDVNPGGPHVSPQLIQMPASGDRLIFSLFETGQVVMLDVSDRAHPRLLSVVELGAGAGPHDIDLTEDGKRLVVTDYFLDEDDFGKVHFEGDHKVHVIKVQRNKLELDRRFNLDFNTAFARPARPHGIASK